MLIRVLNRVRTVIAPYERGLLIRNRAIVDILGPGVYWNLPGVSGVIAVNIAGTRAELPLIETLAKTDPALTDRHFTRVTTGENEMAMVWLDEVATDLQLPGRQSLYWRGLKEVRIAHYRVDEGTMVPDDLARLLSTRGDLMLRARKSGLIDTVTVADTDVGLLRDNGQLVEVLGAGRYTWWVAGQARAVETVSTRKTVLDVNGQEILTRDKVSLRVNLSAVMQVVDPALAARTVARVNEFVYRELQLALRRAIGSRSLDTLLADKSSIDGVVAADVIEPLAAVGVVVSNVGVRDVILPGDMKDILNRVVEAEKTAEANIIRRREETAATRSLLNTAKLMADNPVLVRLKELEALERVSGNIDRITVFGGVDGVMKDLVRIDRD